MPKSRATIKVHRQKEREEPGIYPIDIIRSTWSSDEDQENAVGVDAKVKETKNATMTRSVKSTKRNTTTLCSTVEKLHKSTSSLSLSLCLCRPKGAKTGKTLEIVKSKRCKSSPSLCNRSRTRGNRHRRREPKEPSVPQVYPIETVLLYDDDDYSESDETSGRISNIKIKNESTKILRTPTKLRKSTTKMASKKSIEIQMDVQLQHDISFMESSEDDLFTSAHEGQDIKSSMCRHYRDEEDGARSTDFEYDSKGEPSPELGSGYGVVTPLNPLNRFGFGKSDSETSVFDVELFLHDLSLVIQVFSKNQIFIL